MAAMQTPGDIGDKLIAGGTQFNRWWPWWSSYSSVLAKGLGAGEGLQTIADFGWFIRW
jgi:hypothetical protein